MLHSVQLRTKCASHAGLILSKHHGAVVFIVGSLHHLRLGPYRRLCLQSVALSISYPIIGELRVNQ